MAPIFLIIIGLLAVLLFAFLLAKKHNHVKVFAVVVAVLFFAVLFWLFNPVKMGIIGNSSYGIPGPYWQAAEKTDDWTVNNIGTGKISLSSQKIYNEKDYRARISFGIDTVSYSPTAEIRINRFESLIEESSYKISVSTDSKFKFFISAALFDKDIPDPLNWDEILFYVNNDWLNIYGKDALKLIRQFRKAKSEVELTIIGDLGETAVFKFDVTGFKEAYATFARQVEGYERNNPVDMPLFKRAYRRLGIY